MYVHSEDSGEFEHLPNLIPEPSLLDNVCFDYVPVNKFSVLSGQVFLG